MMSLEAYLTYVAACIVLISIPGPNVTLIIANSLRYGTRAGFATVFGTATGSSLMLAGLTLGIAPVVAFAAEWFWLLKLFGAAYLLWLGIKMLLAKASREVTAEDAPRGKNHFLQGFLVLMGNPKVLLFLGAFVPQFVDTSRDTVDQLMLLSATLLVIALAIDSLYALLAGRAGNALSQSRNQLINRVGGSFLIAGGIWLALARR